MDFPKLTVHGEVNIKENSIFIDKFTITAGTMVDLRILALLWARDRVEAELDSLLVQGFMQLQKIGAVNFEETTKKE